MTELGIAKRRLIDKIVESNWEISPKDKSFNYSEVLFLIQELFDEEGRKYFEPRMSRRGHNVFRNFVEHLLYRNLANYDSMVLITSEKGTGKSSAAIMMAREWCRLIGINFSPKRHIAYSNADVMRKIDNLKKFEPIICDEAIRFAASEDWAKKENKELKKKLAQVRTKHLFYILCFPLKIHKLEKTYLESYTNYWIDLFARGHGAAYVKDKNPTMDSWRLKDFQKIGSYTEFTIKSKIEKQLKKHPNFWQLMSFPKPSAALYENYLKVRESNVYDDANVLKNVSKEDIHYALLVLALRDIMMNDTTLTMNRVILHIKTNMIFQLANKLFSVL